MLSRLRTLPLPVQFIICIGTVALLSIGCFLLRDLIGYRVTALVLLIGASVLAMLLLSVRSVMGTAPGAPIVILCEQ